MFCKHLFLVSYFCLWCTTLANTSLCSNPHYMHVCFLPWFGLGLEDIFALFLSTCAFQILKKLVFILLALLGPCDVCFSHNCFQLFCVNPHNPWFVSCNLPCCFKFNFDLQTCWLLSSMLLLFVLDFPSLFIGFWLLRLLVLMFKLCKCCSFKVVALKVFALMSLKLWLLNYCCCSRR